MSRSAFTFLAAIVATAPVTTSAQQGFALPCEMFKPNEDGSWNVTGEMTLYTLTNQIRLYPGDTIKPGIFQGKVDVSEMIKELEKRCE